MSFRPNVLRFAWFGGHINKILNDLMFRVLFRSLFHIKTFLYNQFFLRIDCQNNNKNDMKLFHDLEMKKKSLNKPGMDPGKILLNIGKLPEN